MQRGYLAAEASELTLGLNETLNETKLRRPSLARSPNTVRPHSYLKATIGSTLVARRAGM